MKRKIFICVCFLFAGLTTLGQSQTSVFKPGPMLGIDAFVSSYPGLENTNFGTNQDIAAVSWTASGTPFDSRTYFKFDLSSIPITAQIQSATLNLTFNPNSGHAQGNQGDNECFIRRVTSFWDESSITWNSQPTNSPTNQTLLATSANSAQSYPNIDVTLLVEPMVANPGSNYGFLLMLQTEAVYRSMVFASSDHLDSLFWPELSIVWEDSTKEDSINCIDYDYGGNEGKDAWVTSYPGNENTNYGNSTDIAAVAWTSAGIGFVSRSYFGYDFSAIPTGAVITSADLSLFANPTSGHAQGHSAQSGSNASVIKMVTSAWAESTITWNNQPTFSSLNEIQLAPSTNNIQDYLSINILPLVQDAVNAPSNYFGFQYSLVIEQQFRSMVFASTDHSNVNLRPSLRVCYETLVAATRDVIEMEAYITAFPNPSSSTMSISISGWNPGEVKISVYTIESKLVSEATHMLGTSPISLDGIEEVEAGIYFLRVENTNSESLQTILIKQ